MVSWCTQPFGHNTHGPKSGRGCFAPALSGGAGSPSKTMWPGMRPTSDVQSGISIHLAMTTIDMGRIVGGGLLCPLFGVELLPCGGAGSPSKTMWSGPRRTSIPWYLDPSNSLATIHQRHRQIGQTDNGPIALFFVQATSLNERNAFLVALQVLQDLLHCNFLLLLRK